MSPDPPDIRIEQMAAALELAQEAEAAEVIAALDEAGVSFLVLKGRSVQVALYDPGERRISNDLDVLVPEPELPAARRTLADLGLRDPLSAAPAGERTRHAETWSAPGRSLAVDLHWTIIGAEASSQLVWDCLSASPRSIGYGDQVAPSPDDVGVVMLCALHAAQHGRREPRPRDELRRALGRYPLSTWQSAATLADRIEAVPAFAAGLSLEPEGAELLGRLDLPPVRTPAKVLLHAQTAPRGAVAFSRLAEVSGPVPKLRYGLSRIFPSRVSMRAIHPLARRGRIGMALAYLGRVPLVLRHAPTGLWAWMRARRGF